MIVDDPFLVRLEAIDALGDMAKAFRELTSAWMPKGETPSLRDLFAAMAFQGIVNGWVSTDDAIDIFPADDAALDSYKIADAMMKARIV